MGLFRSEEMGLFSITIDKDSAWEVMTEMGKLDCLHFLDLNRHEQIFNRTYANLIRRCDEAERRIRYIEHEARKFGLTLKKPRSVEQFLTDMEDLTKLKRIVIIKKIQLNHRLQALILKKLRIYLRNQKTSF